MFVPDVRYSSFVILCVGVEGGGGLILHFIANYWTETIRGFSITFFLPLERTMYFYNKIYIFEMLFHPLYITRHLNNVYI